MPSIGHRPLKYKNRYLILQELRRKNQTRKSLQDIFEAAIGKHLPRKKPVIGAGFTETTLTYKTPLSSKLRFNQLYYELRRDNLVSGGSKENSPLKITACGLLWLKKFKDNPPIQLPRYSERGESSSRFIIVAYDIPVKSTALRNWLRKSLKALGMTATQQSVFIGKVKIPVSLLQAIVQLNLDKCVEICEVTKAGTVLKVL